jgi:hypothetical protein
MHKRDLKDAFRTIPVSPYDYWLLIFEWEGEYYVDIFLPFGLATSPCLFNLFAEALHWILEHIFIHPTVHYLDDFLSFGGHDSLFGNLCSYLGLTEKASKSLDGTVVDFTGIEIDSEKMEIRLPEDKHLRALKAVDNALKKGSIDFVSLRSMIGFLSFCARVIPLGRPFLRNLFNFLHSLRATTNPRAKCRLSPEATRDLKWWSALLKNWNGKRVILPRRTHHFIYTDASGKKGIGGWWGTSAFATRVAKRHRDKHINWKEAYAILVALAKWGPQAQGSKITFMCDNQAIVDAINKTSIRGEAINPLQLILLAAASFDIDIEAKWLSSEENWIADALSRFDLKRLANFKLDLVFSMPYRPNLNPSSPPSRRHTGPQLAALRQRLHDYFGTDLPNLRGSHTPPPGIPTNDIPSSMVTTPSLPPSTALRAGLPTPSTQDAPSQKPSKHTSSGLRTTISKTDSQPPYSMTLESRDCFAAPFVYSVQSQPVNVEKSSALSSSPCSRPSTSTSTITSIYEQRSPSPLPLSSGPANSPGTSGAPTPISFTSPAVQSNSSSLPEPPSSYPAQKRIHTEKAPSSPSHQPTTTPAQSAPSRTCTRATPNPPTTPFLPALPAHSPKHGSSHHSKKPSLLPAKTPPITPGIPFVEAQRTRQSPPALQRTSSKNSVDGNPMQSTDTSPPRRPRNSASPPTANSTLTWPPLPGEAPLSSLRPPHLSPPAVASSPGAEIGLSEVARPPPPVSDFALGLCGLPHTSSHRFLPLGDGDAFSSLFMGMNIS